jgi:hypothetical protein
MPYYYPIQNEQLRMLVMASESIRSLREDDIQKMVAQIANLNPEAQAAMITVLEDEQSQIMAAREAKGITPEMSAHAIQENTAKVYGIRRDFEMSVQKENERPATEESSRAAEDILKKL